MTTTARRRGKSPLPILEGILPLDTSRISVDVIAGATLAALAIPEVMGYTKIAGTPVITGLYTIILPIIVFAILGSSRHLVVGADSATAAILATGLVSMGAVAESTQYVELTSLAALMCGVILVVARLLKLGFIANFLSRSVLIGFLTGVGIQVAMGQFGGIFGVPGQSGTTIEKFVESVRLIPTDGNVPTTLVSAFVLVTIIGLGIVNKRIPGALLAVVVSIIAELRAGPPGRGRHDPRHDPEWPATDRPADRGHDHGQRPGLAADRHLSRHRDPRPERGHVARLRDEVRRPL